MKKLFIVCLVGLCIICSAGILLATGGGGNGGGNGDGKTADNPPLVKYDPDGEPEPFSPYKMLTGGKCFIGTADDDWWDKLLDYILRLFTR